jgi:putative MATE family efflux protein
MTPMKIGIVFRALHIALCPFMVFGWWIFPRLGVSGAAATNLIAHGFGASLGMWILFTGRTRLHMTFRNMRLDPNIIWRIVRIGIPNSLMQAQQHLSSLVLTWLIVPFGTLSVAAHYIWQRVDVILLTLGFGVGTGAGVLGAQNLGAGQTERAEKSGWLGVGLISIIMLVASVVLLLWADRIVRLFSSEPDLVELTSIFLRIAAASYIARGINNMFMQFLIGVGDTLMVMLGELISTWGILMPLAFFLPRITDLDVYGIRWAIVIRMFFAAAIFVVYFWMGKWKTRIV